MKNFENLFRQAVLMALMVICGSATGADNIVGDAKDHNACREFAEEMAMQTYVYYVDSFVGLTSSQWEAVRKTGATLYRQGNLDLINLRHRDRKLPDPELAQLQRILTDAQLTSLKNFAPFWRGGDSAEDLTAALRQVAEMRIQQLDAEVQLSQVQKRSLVFVAKKTIVPNAVERRINAKKNLERFTEAMNRPDALDPAEKERLLSKEFVFEAMNMSTARIPFLFADERWQNFVNSNLNDTQAKKWKQFTNRRREAGIDLQAYDLARRISGVNLTAPQQIAVHEIFRRAITSQGANLGDAFILVRDFDVVASVTTKQEFIEAIGEQNWAKLAESTKRSLSGGMDRAE